MNFIWKHYIKTALLYSLIYGIIFGLINYFNPYNTNFTILGFVFQILFFGIFMSIFMVYFQKRALRKHGVTEFSEESMSTTQHRTIQAALKPSDFIDSIKRNQRFWVFEQSEDYSSIVLKSNQDKSSYKETITVRTDQLPENEFSYHITSSPNLSFRTFDFGVNLKNVNLIADIIERNVYKKP